MMRAVMERLAAYMAWNFEVALSGECPTVGYRGEELPEQGRLMGEYKAAYVFFKCDMKARVECHQFAHNYASTFVCDCCLATQPFPAALNNERLRVLLYTDTSPSAQWR
jgi:hypothetical protein